jgi:hypothetical protein
VITTPIPTPALLRAAPHLAALAILDAALFTAEEVLLAHHPTLLQDIDGILAGERAPPDGSLVPLLIAHFDELRYLLGRYCVDVRTALVAADDDIPF